MRNHLGLYFVATSLVLTGCASSSGMSRVYIDKDISNQSAVIRTPELHTVNVSEIGENMYSKSYVVTQNTYEVFINETIETTKAGANGKLVTSKKNLGKLRKDVNGIGSACFPGDNKYNYCLTDSNNDGNFDKFHAPGYGSPYPMQKPIKYTIKQTEPLFESDSFVYTVLYQGKIGNKIKVSFREFVDNIARPSFTQDIEYELENDGVAVIGFKGLRMEVLKATNLDIKYKVTKDYK